MSNSPYPSWLSGGQPQQTHVPSSSAPNPFALGAQSRSPTPNFANTPYHPLYQTGPFNFPMSGTTNFSTPPRMSQHVVFLPNGSSTGRTAPPTAMGNVASTPYHPLYQTGPYQSPMIGAHPFGSQPSLPTQSPQATPSLGGNSGSQQSIRPKRSHDSMSGSATASSSASAMEDDPPPTQLGPSQPTAMQASSTDGEDKSPAKKARQSQSDASPAVAMDLSLPSLPAAPPSAAVKPQQTPPTLPLDVKFGKKSKGDQVQGAFMTPDTFQGSNLKHKYSVTTNANGSQSLQPIKSVKGYKPPGSEKHAVRDFLKLSNYSDKDAFYGAVKTMAKEAREAADKTKTRMHQFLKLMDPKHKDFSARKEGLDELIRSDARTRPGHHGGYGEDETMQTSLFLPLLLRTAGMDPNKDVKPVSLHEDGHEIDWLDLHKALRNPTGYMPLGGLNDTAAAHPGTANKNDPKAGGRPSYLNKLNATLDEARALEIMRSRHPMSAARRAKRVESRLLRDPKHIQQKPTQGYAPTGRLHSDPAQIDEDMNMVSGQKNASRAFRKHTKEYVGESESDVSDSDVEDGYPEKEVRGKMKTPAGLTAFFRAIQEPNNPYTPAQIKAKAAAPPTAAAKPVAMAD